jgi:hypothetical protein
MRVKGSPSVARRVLLPLCGVLAVGLVLAACGSTSSSPPASTSTTTTTQSNVTTTTSGSSSDTVSSLSQLSASANTATFSATYNYNNGATNETITYAQSPPASLFKSGSGTILNTGTKSYYCAAGHCIEGSSNALGALAYLFNGKTFQETAAAYAVSSSQLADAGVTLNYSTGTYAGQPSNCVTIHVTKGTVSTAVWCVAQNGIMDYWSAGTSEFTLTSYSSSPPSSDFTVPAGDTITTF